MREVEKNGVGDVEKSETVGTDVRQSDRDIGPML
jgi:hypothetical protein